MPCTFGHSAIFPAQQALPASVTFVNVLPTNANKNASH